MKIKAVDDQSETGSEAFAAKADKIAAGTSDPAQPQLWKPPRPSPEAMKSMENTAGSLVIAYLAANLNFKDIPLKEFLDDCEKKILLRCLHLTRGNQKNAAVLLGLKPTALFEKMRKHRINGRQIKLSKKLEALPPDG